MKIWSICLNPIELFIIWSESDYLNYSNKGYIYRARYDGSKKISLVNGSFLRPISLAIDNISDELLSIDYYGNDKKVIHSGQQFFDQYSKLDLYNGFIYWSKSKMIYKINNIKEEFTQFELHKEFSGAYKIIHSSRQPNVSNLCANTNCTHLCLPIEFNTYRCLCPDIKIYNTSEYCGEYVRNQRIFIFNFYIHVQGKAFRWV